MTLIELGEISSGSPEPRPAPPRRADVRRVAAAAVTVLCLLTVTGSARPDPRGLPTLWTMPDAGARITLTEDAVYLLDERGGATVRAYAAADGTPLWSRALERQAGWVSGEVPGTLLVPTSSGVLGDGSSPVVTETVALDAATGAVRWRRPGDASIATPEAVVLGEWDELQNGLRSLRVYGTADGTPLWELAPEAAVMSWTVAGADPRRPDRLLSVTRAGLMQVRRFPGGEPLAEASVPPMEAPREDAYSQVFSSGPHLFLVRLDGGEQKITAYDGDTLKPRWERTGPAASGPFACGTLLCVSTAEGEVDALDPVTGSVRWHGTGWDFAYGVGDGTLLVESHRTTRAQLVDERTGRVLADFGIGSTVLDPRTGTVLSLTLTEPPPRWAVRQRDAATGEVILRGAVPSNGDHGCQLAAGRLACSGGGTLTVTDVG
jgi:outer membrane protein assembly factor BamB